MHGFLLLFYGCERRFQSRNNTARAHVLTLSEKALQKKLSENSHHEFIRRTESLCGCGAVSEVNNEPAAKQTVAAV